MSSQSPRTTDSTKFLGDATGSTQSAHAARCPHCGAAWPFDGPMMTRKDCATKCGLGLRTIESALASKQLRAFRFGKAVRVAPCCLDAFMAAHAPRVQPSPF
jgi:uncharacterized protein (DUF983 family)